MDKKLQTASSQQPPPLEIEPAATHLSFNMRLFLASHRFGEFSTALLDLAGGPGGRVAVVSNALDFIPASDRLGYARAVYDQMQVFRDLGLEPFDLDLRRYFSTPQTLGSALEDASLVWATGGNAFLLRLAMRLSGFDELIVRLLSTDRLAYGGYSAGAVVAGPSLEGIDLMDAPDLEVAGYPRQTIWDGLGLIDQNLVPHYRSDHPESADAERVVAAHHAALRPYATLADGDVLIREGELTSIHRAAT